MAVGLIGTSYFTSWESRVYRVRIYQEGHIGLPWTIENNTDGKSGFTIKSLILTREGDEQNPFKTIIATTLEMTIVLKLGHHIEWADGLAITKQSDNYVHVEIRHPLLPEVYQTVFIGNIRVDISERSMFQYRPSFLIRCIDGLSDLKSTAFPEYAHPLQLRNLSTYIALCLSTIPWTSELKSHDILFGSFMTWYENNHLENTEFLLDKIFLRQYFYNEDENTGTIKYNTCYDILDEILSGFACHIFQYRGYYLIAQIGSKVETNNYVADNYKYFIGSDRVHKSDRDGLGVNNFDLTEGYLSNFYPINTYPKKTWLPASRNIVLTQKGDYGANLFFSIPWEYKVDEAIGELTQITTSTSNDSLRSVLLSFDFEAAIWTTQGRKYAAHKGEYCYEVLKITIKVGNKKLIVNQNRVNQPLVISNFQDGYAAVVRLAIFELSNDNRKWGFGKSYFEWSENENAAVYLLLPVRDINERKLGYYNNFYFTSPAIESVGNIEVQVEHFQTYVDRNAQTVWSPRTDSGISPYNREVLVWKTSNIFATVGQSFDDYEDTQQDNQQRKLILHNNNNNSIDYEFNYNFGDFADHDINQKLFVETAPNEYASTTEWNNGNGEINNLVFTQLKEVLSLTKNASPRIDLTYRQKGNEPLHQYIDTITINSKKYSPLYQKLDLIEDRITGVYWEIGKALIFNIDPEIIIKTPKDDEIIIPPGFREDSDPSLQGNGYYKQQTGFLGQRISIDDYEELHLLPRYETASINRSFNVIVGSAVYWYKDKDINELRTAEYTIDINDRSIVFYKHFSKPIRIQIDVRPAFVRKTAASAQTQ